MPRDAPTEAHVVHLLDNGHLLKCARIAGNRTFHKGGPGGRIRRFDWDGNSAWQFDHSDDGYGRHHAIEPLPNRNLLIPPWESKNNGHLDTEDAGRCP